MTTHANLGMQLEQEVESSNLVYQHKGIAVVQKIPTPFKPIRDRKGNFSKLIPAKKSTVDFIGCLNGRGIAFDAKETKRPSLLLDNVHEQSSAVSETIQGLRRLCVPTRAVRKA